MLEMIFLVELILIFIFVPGTVQVGSDSMQGAGAPTMFHAMKRIVDSLIHQSMGEGALERAILQYILLSLVRVDYV
jgi:hypothetical protein